MARSRCHRRATHRAPNAASKRGLAQAMAELYGPEKPMPADQCAHELHALELAPYNKPQGDLPLSLPKSTPQ